MEASVTKYNPIYRDKDWKYSNDEWMHISEIGEYFNDKLFTYEEYIEIESRYIESVYIFLKYYSCKTIKISNLEKHYDGINDKDLDKKKKYDPQLQLNKYYDICVEGVLIHHDIVKYVVQLILRGYLWCNLVCSDNDEIIIRFGYDYYMYFKSNTDFSSIKNDIENLGLFFEK